MVLVSIKWNKELFQNVNLILTDSVDSFREIVLKLTNVPKHRQKLMAKGWSGVLKDDFDLSSLKLDDGHQILLMGTAEVMDSNSSKIVFLEDLTKDENMRLGISIPNGLTNLGNTCYLNSVLQCLRFSSSLRSSIKHDSLPSLVGLISKLFDELDNRSGTISPLSFVYNLRASFPQFAETSHGNYAQQDADEFYSVLSGAIQHCVGLAEFNNILGIEFQEKMICQESGEVSMSMFPEYSNKLICNIQGGTTTLPNTDHLRDGLLLSLESTVEKFSEQLGKNSTWTKKLKISSLPNSICIQFMRFFWKPTPDSRDHTGVKCKILRAVSFPEV